MLDTQDSQLTGSLCKDDFTFHPHLISKSWHLYLMTLREKVSKYEVFSGLYFPVFGLNTEIYSVKLRIQSKYGKIRTRKNSTFGHPLRGMSDWLRLDFRLLTHS